jgi:heme exporter protein C
LLAGTGTVVGSAVIAVVLAPADAVQGQWQRLMYLHVPAAWLAYLCFAGVLVASCFQLRRPASRLPARWGRAAAELGVAATGVTLLAGSIWGHAVWGVWWAWDARLVSTAVMFLVYLAYLALRWTDGRLPGRAATWVGVIGFAIVPVVHFSVIWFTTLHQQATLLAPPTKAPPIDPRMAVALGLSVLAFTAVGVLALILRMGLVRTLVARRRAADELRRS